MGPRVELVELETISGLYYYDGKKCYYYYIDNLTTSSTPFTPLNCPVLLILCRLLKNLIISGPVWFHRLPIKRTVMPLLKTALRNASSITGQYLLWGDTALDYSNVTTHLRVCVD